MCAGDLRPAVPPLPAGAGVQIQGGAAADAADDGGAPGGAGGGGRSGLAAPHLRLLI